MAEKTEVLEGPTEDGVIWIKAGPFVISLQKAGKKIYRRCAWRTDKDRMEEVAEARPPKHLMRAAYKTAGRAFAKAKLVTPEMLAGAAAAEVRHRAVLGDDY